MENKFMMLCEITITDVVVIGTSIGMFVVALIAMNKKQDVKVEQPVHVTITEELHKVFASKPEFERHLADFREKHNTIWNTLRAENTRIGSEVVATREAISGLEATTELQNQQLTAIQSDIKQLIRRV